MSERRFSLKFIALISTIEALVPGGGRIVADRNVGRAFLWFLPQALIVALILQNGTVKLIGFLLNPANSDSLFLIATLLIVYRCIASLQLLRRLLQIRIPLTQATKALRPLGKSASVNWQVSLFIFIMAIATATLPIAISYRTISAVRSAYQSLYHPSQAEMQEDSAMPTEAPYSSYNILLLGSDAGPGRWSQRTDSMVIVNINNVTNRVNLISIPRNLRDVPLPPDYSFLSSTRLLPGLLNSAFEFADRHASSFVDAPPTRGFLFTKKLIENLTGLRIDGVAAVNLLGFIAVVDSFGGVDINLKEEIYDANFGNPYTGKIQELRISKGLQHLNGEFLLAYLRSRHQDSDYGRIRRQQEVLTSLISGSRLLKVLLDPVAALGKVQSAIWTNIPHDSAARLTSLFLELDSPSIRTFTLSPGSGFSPSVGFNGMGNIRNAVHHFLRP